MKRTGELLSVPTGNGLIGRVIVDPLGRPLDGKGEIDSDSRRPLEFRAAGIAERQPGPTSRRRPASRRSTA